MMSRWHPVAPFGMPPYFWDLGLVFEPNTQQFRITYRKTTNIKAIIFPLIQLSLAMPGEYPLRFFNAPIMTAVGQGDASR